MKREEKQSAMKRTSYDLNEAKDRMYRSACKLEEAGLNKDAEQLMKMIYRLESFQNKYNAYRLL